MTCYPSKILLALVVLVATASIAKASLVVAGIRVNKLRIHAQVYCTPNGNPILGANSPPLSNVEVRIECNGGKTTIAQALTNTTGFLEMTIKDVVGGILFDPSRCYAVVKLPVARCTALPRSGTLEAALNLVKNVAGDAACLVAGAWIAI